MKNTIIVALTTLAAILGAVASVAAAEVPAINQPMDPVTLAQLTSDLVRSDDGGIKARAAADQAVQLARPDLLFLGLTNRLYDVRIHSVEALSRCLPSAQVTVLESALNTLSLWSREAKVGELIVSQERFLQAMSAALQKSLNQPGSAPDLLDPAVREKLATELKTARRDQLKADAGRWDDGGQAARVACDAAVKLLDVDLLLCGVSNRLYDVKAYAMDCLGQLGRAQQRAGLRGILCDDTLWIKEQKVGELIVSQEQFAAKVEAMAARLLPAGLPTADLFEAKTRSRIVKELGGE